MVGAHVQNVGLGGPSLQGGVQPSGRTDGPTDRSKPSGPSIQWVQLSSDTGTYLVMLALPCPPPPPPSAPWPGSKRHHQPTI